MKGPGFRFKALNRQFLTGFGFVFSVLTSFGQTSPETLTGLNVWLDAGSITGVSDGSPISVWTDGSGLGNDAVAQAGNEPIFMASGPGGLPAILFEDEGNVEGSGDSLDISTTLSGSGTPFTVFAVFRSDSAGDRDTVLQQLDDDAEGVGRTALYTQNNAASQLRVYSFASGTALQSSENYTAGEWNVVSLIQNDLEGRLLLRELGSDVGSKTPLSEITPVNGAWRIGDNKPRTGGLNGAVAELVIYDRALDSFEVDGVELFLMNKYGLTPEPSEPNLVFNPSFEEGGIVPENFDGLDVNYITRGGDPETFFGDWYFGGGGAGIDNDGTFPDDNGPFFIGGSVIPDGRRGAFLQGVGSFVYQVINGVNPGEVYELTYFESGRQNFGSAPILQPGSNGVPLAEGRTLDQDGNFEKRVFRIVPDSSQVTVEFDVVGGSGDVTALVDNVSLVRLPNPTPWVFTRAATDITATTATIHGSATPYDSETTVWFEYGTSPVYGSQTPQQSIGSGFESIDFSAALEGLTVGTTYHFRAVAENANGVAYGENMTFTPAFDCITIQPELANMVIGETTELTVTLPSDLVETMTVNVTVTAMDPLIAFPVGADENGAVTLVFEQGGATSQTVTVDAFSAGSVDLIVGNDSNVCVANSATVAVAGGVGVEELVFFDPFGGFNFDISFLDDLSRQSGSAAPITYGEAESTMIGGLDDDLTRLENDALLLESFGYVWVSPNYDFVDGGNFSVEFDIHPGSNNPFGDNDNWAGIVLGATTQGPFMNASDGFGVLFRNNGNIQVFNENAAIYGSPEPVAPIGVPFHVRIDVQSTGFLGDSPAQISMSIDETPVVITDEGDGFTYVKQDGFNGNYITLQAIGDFLMHTFDNLGVTAESCVSASPSNIETRVNQPAPQITVKVPAAALESEGATVTLTSDNPAVATLEGAMDGVLEVVFPQGSSGRQTINVITGVAGTAIISLENDRGICEASPVTVQVRGSLITNPSFEIDPLVDFPGYRAISGWTGTGGTGINDSTGPFHDNAGIPDREKIALVQGTQSISQTIEGLNAGATYWLEFRYNTRNCCGDKLQEMIVYWDEEEILYEGDVQPAADAGYHTARIILNPSSESGTLRIESVATGDSTLLLDAFSLVERTAADIVIANPSFEGTGTPPFPGYISPNAISGWSYAETGNYGVNAAGPGPFADNGVASDQDRVAFIQGIGTLSQVVSGLAVGTQYRLDYDYNARSGNSPRLETLLDGSVVFSSDVQPVGGVNPYYKGAHYFTASSDTIEIGFSQVAEGDQTIVIDNVRIVPDDAPPPVELTISLNGADVEISWPVNGSSLTLQSSPVISPAVWSNVSEAAVEEGGNWIIRITGLSEAAFYRLIAE